MRGGQVGGTHGGRGVLAEWHAVGLLLRGLIYAHLRVKDLEKVQTLA